jgi:hypothetical protein
MPSAGEALQWTLPPGGVSEKASGMRVATLRPAADSKVDVSVIRLPGPAGGELSNVNRWRGQLSLAPIDEAERTKSRKEVKSPAGAVSIYEFGNDSTKQRMVAGLLMVDGNSWFIKMTGDSADVVASRGAFETLIASLRAPGAK